MAGTEILAYPETRRDFSALAELHKDLSEVMAEVGYVQKDGTNAHFKYKYASAEAVLRKVNAALSSRGIAVGSMVELLGHTPDFTNATVRVTLEFMRGGASATVQGLGQGSDKSDKAVMKANTAALKYALANAFMISWGDDPEADASVDQPAKTAKKPSNDAKLSPEVPKLLPPDVDILLRGVEACTTLDSLNELKPRIQAAKEKLEAEEYKRLTTAWGAKSRALKEA